MADLVGRRERARAMRDTIARQYFGTPAREPGYRPVLEPCPLSTAVFVVGQYAPIFCYQWGGGASWALCQRGLKARWITQAQALMGEWPAGSVVITPAADTGVHLHLRPVDRLVRIVHDDVWGSPVGFMEDGPGRTPEQTKEIGDAIWTAELTDADALAVGAEPLVDVVRAINPEVDAVVVPWAAPPAPLWPALPPRPARPGRRIGWQGGFGGREGDFALLRAPLTRLARSHPQLEVVFWGGQPSWHGELPRFTSLPWRPLSARGFHEEYIKLDFDIAVAPIAGNRINNSRSGAKFIDATVAGYPVVASDYGPYRRLAEAGAPIVTVPDDPAAWESTLAGLLEDEGRRAELVEAARQWVAKHATLDVVADDWHRVINAAASAL